MKPYFLLDQVFSSLKEFSLIDPNRSMEVQ